MNHRPIRSILLLTLSLLSALLIGSPFTSLIPKANAAIPGSSALLGFFNEQAKSSAVVNNGLGAGSFVTYDLNVSGAGPIKGFIIGFNWTTSALAYQNSSFGSYTVNPSGCGTGSPPQNCGRTHVNSYCNSCLFNGLGTGIILNRNDTAPAGGYYLSITDVCTTSCSAYVPGDGILFRITFMVVAASQHAVIHFNTAIVQNPGTISLQFFDGYFDNNGTPLLNYPMSVAPTTATVLRKVSGTNTTTTSVTLGTFTGTGTVAFGALGLPRNSSPSFTLTSCSAACSSTLTITVNGGQQGGPLTTPSGTYSIAVFANATSGPSGMVIEAWLKLIVKPPNPPNFAITTGVSTTFTQEAGSSNSFSLTTHLAGGANDSLTESTTCGFVSAVTCVLFPSSGIFDPISGNFATSLNVSTTPSAPTGAYVFNVTGVTSGTYSETTVTKVLTFIITITRTHDLAATGETMPKLFSYEGVSLVRPSGHPINMTMLVTNLGTSTESFSVNATAKVSLVNEPFPSNLTFVDSNHNGVWDSGILVFDPKIKFYDTNSTGVWGINKPVIYDTIGNGIYSAGDTVINGTAPAFGVTLKSDPKIKFEDQDGSGLWAPGKIVAYDSNNNGVYDTGEPVITSSQFAPLRETVIHATSGTGTYQAGDVVISGTAPTIGTPLNKDNNIKFVDTNFDGKWEPGKPVVYDSNGDGVYDKGDVLIAGSAPSLGVLVGTASSSSLAPADTLISGSAVNATTLSTDAKIKFADVNGNGVYDGGQESVVYDSNGNGLFDAPDPRIKFVDLTFAGHWVSGDPVVIDQNLNGRYDAGEILLSGPRPTVGRALSTDLNLRFVDVSSATWQSGDKIIYDAHGNGVYAAGDTVLNGTAPAIGTAMKGEPVIAGPAPRGGTSLLTDSRIKFHDTNSNGLWDNSKPVILSRNGGLFYFDGRRSLIVNIDPENAPHGNYVIFAYVVPVAGEANLANNHIASVLFTQRLRGDANFDCKVNIFDLTAVAGIFGATSGSPGFNVAADMNNDGVINIFDLSLVGGNFGATC